MRNFIRIFLTAIYVIFTGASISAIRALIFAILYLGCKRRGLRADTVMILSATALLHTVSFMAVSLRLSLILPYVQADLLAPRTQTAASVSSLLL